MGVDISENMIELARQEETREPLGIEYIVCDVLELGEIDKFDLVVATYLLHYAQTKEQLLKMCQSIYVNLKPGGHFVTINNNMELSPNFYSKCEKYGQTQTCSGPLDEGSPITQTFTTVDGQKVSFDNYYFSKATYEQAFKNVGFKDIRWHPLKVSPEGVQEFGQEYWQDILDYPPEVGIECVK